MSPCCILALTCFFSIIPSAWQMRPSQSKKESLINLKLALFPMDCADGKSAFDLVTRTCQDCRDRHLDCFVPGPAFQPGLSKSIQRKLWLLRWRHRLGLALQEVPPMVGHAKLEAPDYAFQCPPPAEIRCNVSAQKSNYKSKGCSFGYSGPLCMACETGFYSKAGYCAPCSVPSNTLPVLGILLALVSILYCCCSCSSRRTDGTSEAGRGASFRLELLSLQAPFLLHMVQLWLVVVAGLRRERGRGAGTTASPVVDWDSEFYQWFMRFMLYVCRGIPPLSSLLLTAHELEWMINVQCSVGSILGRSIAAIISPVLPLVLLLACGILELAWPSAGIGLALKLISLLFIGGAFSCYQLVVYQAFDGAGEPLGSQAFSKLFPDLGNSEALQSVIITVIWQVHLVAALAYTIIIPCFLLRVMARQHVALQDTRLFVACSASDGGNTQILRLQPLGVLPLLKKDDGADRHLLAAAVAHMVVHMHGPVKVELVQDAIHVTPLEDAQSTTLESHDFGTLLASRLVPKHKLDVQRARNIQQMLSERGVLESTADPLLIGAKTLLSKYALGGKVWMEVAMKLYIVSLICVSGTERGLQFTVVYTLSMASVVGLVSPYFLPQLNLLSSFCFVCLAITALGVDRAWEFVARAALVAPFLLCVYQALRPSSPEYKALKLITTLTTQLSKLQQGAPVRINVFTAALV
ncbi:unnamed protein product [Symbiodinium sp. CCMP2456]|nr:unnamed protein product [Symbiodinium sp. CCMP2456]